MTDVQDPFGDAGASDDPAQAMEHELFTALASLHDTVNDFFRSDRPVDGELIGYGDALSTVAQAAEQAQHLGLADIAVRLDERAGTTEDDNLAELRKLLLAFVDAAVAYVSHPGDPETQRALLACISAGSDALVAPDELEILKLMLGMAPVQEEAMPPEQPGMHEYGSLAQPVEGAVLGAFLQEAQGLLAEAAERMGSAEDGDHPEATAAAINDLESLIRGSEFTGLIGLSFALRLLQEQLGAGAADGAEILPRLAPAIIGYLETPADPERIAWLAAQFPGTDSSALATLLAGVELTENAPVKPPRAITASPEDISLELPEDINPELLDGLLIELPVQTAAFANAVQRIVEGQASRQDLIVAKRAAHTLKGAANTVGIHGIATLTHTLEDILLALSDNSVLPNLGLAQTLSYASDCLEAMSEALAGSGAPPDDALNVLQDVLNWANRIDAQGIEVARGAAAAEAAATTAAESAPPQPERDTASMLRVPAALIDELLRLVGETMTSTAQIQNRIEQAMAQARTINRQNALLQQLVGELETMVDLRGVTGPGKAMSAARTDDEEFDALELEQYNELHTLSRRLAEVATDAREMGVVAEEHLASLADLQEAQGRLQIENQKAVMTTRMVPVNSVFSRLQRGVRQACRILDKDVELVLRGEGTVMDGNVLQELIDALMHMLRNAVDHGIESPEQRAAAGKPARGRIELEFRRDGDYIAVRCTDDGRGLDLAAIRANAERNGLIAPETALSADETARLILIPGVSTRKEATQVSGRGIGMDAVNSKVLELKGSLHLSSRKGQGLTVELKLPVTLLSTHALLVRVRNKVLAVSSRGVEDIHYVSAETVDDIPNGLQEFTSESYELAELETVLDLPGDRRTRGRRGWPVLMVRLVSGGLRAVVVQEVLESRSVVVKSLGPYVPRIQGLIGATILGDGSVAAVIDLPDRLYSPAHAQLPLLLRRNEGPADVLPQTDRRRVLVVDDSISARRSLVQVVRDAGYDVRAASDGLEAIAILEQRVPHLIITDMEMPRMNGFELAQHVRAAESSHHVPIIMVTSRTTAKHLRQAELAGVNIYLTKPFNDAELLGHVEGLLRMVPETD